MSRVCVVVEHREAMDAYESYDEVKSVAGNPTIAENLIESYKNNLIKESYAEGGIATDLTEVGRDVSIHVEQHADHITYSYRYYWTIEQFDIIES